MQRAACVLIMRPDGKLLSISRGHNTQDWALPGGKVERRETPTEAARNELREETGVNVAPHARFVPIFRAAGHDFITTTYRIDGGIIFPAVLQSIPFEGYVDWKTPAELSAAGCSLADYFTATLQGLQ